MKQLSRIAIVWMAVGIGFTTGLPAHAFTTVKREAFTAVAITSGGFNAMMITAEPLPAQAFFGKNLQIPLEVSSDPSPLDTQNLSIEIRYRLVDANGTALTPYNGVPVRVLLSPSKRNTLKGVAIVPRSDLVGIQRGGSLEYFFRVRQRGQDTILTNLPTNGGISRAPAGAPETEQAPPSPFKVGITNIWGPVPVGPAGAVVKVPDLFINDGRTGVKLDPGVLSNQGQLTITQEDAAALPPGPGGLQPVQVYSFKLDGTSLLRSAQFTFSYPAETNGRLVGSNANPLDLAPYWFDGSTWRILSKANIDTTLHTVTATGTRFSTFALFPTGPVLSADLRPTERVLTPNGDGINDFAIFSVGIDEVHIFDIRGRRVRIIPGPNPVWDGKEDDGKVVESGVYVYQFTASGERVSGVIAVAK